MFPVSYFDENGAPCDGGVSRETAESLEQRVVGMLSAYTDKHPSLFIETVVKALREEGFVVTQVLPEFPGCITRIQIDAQGQSAAEVERALHEYGMRCDAASQASEVSYGRCVIERNLEAAPGEPLSWRGRLVLHPVLPTGYKVAFVEPGE